MYTCIGFYLFLSLQPPLLSEGESGATPSTSENIPSSDQTKDEPMEAQPTESPATNTKT